VNDARDGREAAATDTDDSATDVIVADADSGPNDDGAPDVMSGDSGDSGDDSG
jgi:hypothetical protein